MVVFYNILTAFFFIVLPWRHLLYAGLSQFPLRRLYHGNGKTSFYCIQRSWEIIHGIYKHITLYIFNKPGVARTVLQTPLSLIHSFIASIINSYFSSQSSNYHHSQTIRAKDLTFWDNVHHQLCVTCHMTHVMCQV